MTSKFLKDLNSAFLSPTIISIFFLGMACGFPFALTASTLKTWLASHEISMKSIAMFGYISMPYMLKFLWSPLVDGIKIPYLANIFGHRRSWLLLTQACLVVAIIFLAMSNPEQDLLYCAITATIVAFLSATQDIVVDAYRIEKLPENLQSLGVTMYIYGYRLGLFFCGAGLLLIADMSSWQYAYFAGAGLFVISIITTLFSSEPSHKITSEIKSYHEHLQKILILPFKDFTQTKGWVYLLLFVVVFKLGDAISGSMTNPFLTKTGFSLTEIAAIVKTFGLSATLIGSFIGGIIVIRFGLFRCLIFAAIIQMLSNLMFILQDHVGYNLSLLTATILIENVSGSIGDVVFIGYLSSLCNVNFAASQYALLSSLATLGRNLVSGSLGFIIDDYGWTMYFMISIIAALPGILMLFRIHNIKRTFSS